MRGLRTKAGAVAVWTAVMGVGCNDIVPNPSLDAPQNTCPCEGLAKGGTAPRCTDRGRCEIPAPSGRPSYPFWILVHVPDSSIYAPGRVFGLHSASVFSATQDATVATRCRPPLCLRVGALGAIVGSYKVTERAALDAGFPLAEGTSLPVEVRYEPTGSSQRESFGLLPFDDVIVRSRVTKLESGEPTLQFVRALPQGRYREVLLPEPPYDAFFPPIAQTRSVLDGRTVVADMVLGQTVSIDDPGGDSRVAEVTRAAGLEGFRVWLIDRATQRRISVVRTLQGIREEVRLTTAGERRTPSGGLGDEVAVMVAPPADSEGLPRLVSRLFGGAGLRNLNYPPLPPPAVVAGAVEGAVVSPLGRKGGAFARFQSVTLFTREEASTLLRYDASAEANAAGEFSLRLPPGTYEATALPPIGSGCAVSRRTVTVSNGSNPKLAFPCVRQVRAEGRAVLADGRPLANADVIATSLEASADPTTSLGALPIGARASDPSPARTRTDGDGRFALDLDPGRFIISVEPKIDSGFPRTGTRLDVTKAFPGEVRIMPELIVRAPIRLAFALKAPTTVENPIERAVVRIFSEAANATQRPIEIGRAITNTSGEVEILLAEAEP